MIAHHVYLSLETHRPVSLEETIRSWESGACRSWRRRKMRLDGQEQLRQIELHKYFVSQRSGYDVGWERAAREWIENHAAAWRNWWEEQERSDP